MAGHDILKPEWIRLTDDRGNFVGNLDPNRYVLMSVKRGGTAFFDLAQIIEEWRRTRDAVKVE